MLRDIARASLSSDDIFGEFVRRLASAPPRRSVTQLGASRKRVGDLWEEFCVQYLLLRGYVSARLLADVSDEELDALSMRRRDVGIDIVARDGRGDAHAVQCKFRSRGATVGWREVSTFEALCARTGPWARHVVMTNARGVRREGGSTERDVTIARGSYAAMGRHEWNAIAGLGPGRTCGGARDDGASADDETIREVRERWLRRLEGASGHDRHAPPDLTSLRPARS